MAKPVLLSVDDDADVLRSIERDLRSQYGAEYRPATTTDVSRTTLRIILFLYDVTSPEIFQQLLTRQDRATKLPVANICFHLETRAEPPGALIKRG